MVWEHERYGWYLKNNVIHCSWVGKSNGLPHIQVKQSIVVQDNDY